MSDVDAPNVPLQIVNIVLTSFAIATSLYKYYTFKRDHGGLCSGAQELLSTRLDELTARYEVPRSDLENPTVPVPETVPSPQSPPDEDKEFTEASLERL